MKSTSLVVWDLDGTLVDSMPSAIEAFNDAIEPFLGKRLPTEELLSYFGSAEPIILERIIGKQNLAKSYEIFKESTIKRLDKSKVFDGITEALNQISKKDAHQAIFTGRGREGTEIILKHNNLRDHFKLIVTANEVENPKPDPEGLHLLTDRFRIAPRKTAMIGDSLFDIQAGKKARVVTVACLWSSEKSIKRSDFEALRPDFIAEHPSEVLAFLEKKIF
ncbi:MAG: HAD family hydrolase [Bacteriovoracia bacterium]